MLEESLGLLSIPVNGVGLLICSLFWTGMYYLCIGLSRTLAPKVYSGLSAEDRIHWNNYAWSATHGVIGFLGACRSVAGVFPGVPDSHFDSTPLQRFYIQLTLAFFLVDSIHLAIDWKVKGSLMMLIHHIIFPVSYGTGLYVIQPAYGMYVMAVLQLCEITTPFLHVRWFLSKLGMKQTLLYRANGLAFSVLFILVRGALMTVMYYRIWSRMPNLLYHAGCPACTVVMTSAWAFQALQYIWCVKVVTSALAFFRTGDEGGSKPRKSD